MKKIVIALLFTSFALFSAKAQLKIPLKERVKEAPQAFIDAIAALD